ncbi:MAG: type VII secretion target [Streptosporangiales bacterium]|nr:type VII secretion target [Streptosporangiales bacterium]
MGFWDDLNPVHDVKAVVGDVKTAWTEVTSGAQTAPTPTIGSSPPPAAQPNQWTAPSVDSSGHIKVHHGALTSAADVIKSYVSELESAINEVNGHIGSFDSLAGWATGASFCGNLTSAVTAFAQAGGDTSQAHADAAKNLSDSSSTYDSTESANAQLSNGWGR